MTDQSTTPCFDLAAAVTTWIEETERLLAQAQTALESLRFHCGVAPDAQQTLYQLLVVLRQRRTDAPTPEAVRTWIRTLADFSLHRGPARFRNARSADTPPPSSPPA